MDHNERETYLEKIRLRDSMPGYPTLEATDPASFKAWRERFTKTALTRRDREGDAVAAAVRSLRGDAEKLAGHFEPTITYDVPYTGTKLVQYMRAISQVFLDDTEQDRSRDLFEKATQRKGEPFKTLIARIQGYYKDTYPDADMLNLGTNPTIMRKIIEAIGDEDIEKQLRNIHHADVHALGNAACRLRLTEIQVWKNKHPNQLYQLSIQRPFLYISQEDIDADQSEHGAAPAISQVSQDHQGVAALQAPSPARYKQQAQGSGRNQRPNAKSQSQASSSKGQGRCFNCGNRNHKVKDCRANKPNSGVRFQVNRNPGRYSSSRKAFHNKVRQRIMAMDEQEPTNQGQTTAGQPHSPGFAEGDPGEVGQTRSHRAFLFTLGGKRRPGEEEKWLY